MAEKFLEQIARYYTAPERIDSLAETLFIMPNKRSGMFLKHYIQKHAGEHPMFMPRFATFQHLASTMLRVPQADKNELLFMLYNAYLEEVTKALHQEKPTEFDRFIFWGDMILSDFDMIDKSLADPVKLYANLSDLHDLQADYLTDEQKEVITHIWGPTAMTGENDSFWFPSGKALAKTDIVRKFVSLWEILGPIYLNLQHRLEAAGLSTAGSLIRKAAETLRDNIPQSLKRRKFVFVGHSDLSTAELSIMDSLTKAGQAEFFWDTDLPLYSSADSDLPGGDALQIIRRLERTFPMPADFKPTTAHHTPQINVYGIPSAVGMAKCAAATIREVMKLNGDRLPNPIETSIVLPDASLLMPLLLALPDNLKTLNVTMSMPYADTTFATLLRSIIMLQSSVRRNSDGHAFYPYEQVMEILLHPHINLLFPSDIDLFRQKVIDAGKKMIDGHWLTDEIPQLDFIFQPIEDPDSLNDTCTYLDNLFSNLKSGLEKVSAGYSSASASEIQAIDYFAAQIASLRALIDKYGVAMKEATFLHLFERILNARPINLEGTPLSGMQIMGVLETRCLDFDNIIYLSMNEKVFPRHDYVRTMIPNTLRRGYGLPTIQQSESFYSYYFFRSLSRARNITLFYDSRTPGSATGEMSRFLTRLLYLPGNARVNLFRTNLDNKTPQAESIIIEKTPAIRKQLSQYLAGGSRSLSASTLKNLFHCPLRFYLQNVNSMNYDDEPHDYLTAAQIGSIFHDTMQFLFRDYEGQLITPEILDFLATDTPLKKAFYESLAKHTDYKPGASDDKMQYEHIVVRSAVLHQVRCVLEAEKKRIAQQEAFTYIKGEDAIPVKWEVIPGRLAVNFLMIIDRIDRISANHYRFVDYKTGSDKTSIGENIDNVFKSSRLAGILQLMIYAEAYHDTVNPNASIDISLMNIGDIVRTGNIEAVKFNRKQLPACPDFPPEFRQHFNTVLEDFFLGDSPIVQTDDTDNCQYCNFNNICNRRTSSNDFDNDTSHTL